MPHDKNRVPDVPGLAVPHFVNGVRGFLNLNPTRLQISHVQIGIMTEIPSNKADQNPYFRYNVEGAIEIDRNVLKLDKEAHRCLPGSSS